MKALQLFTLGLLLGLPLSAAHADVTTGDSAEEEEEDDDKGCSTLVAPASAASLALGVGIVFLQRRRDDD